MSERGYQYDFSKDNAAMHSVAGRRRKANTICAVLRDGIGADALANARILNVGCSTGLIDDVLAEHAAHVVGVDIDGGAIAAANARRTKNNLEFRIGDAMALDFPEHSFDIVICSQVYEHVPDPARMMAQIHRVLAQDGVCYFAATNRLCITEQHYQLRFLSVMPVSWAHRYLKLRGRGNYYHERHLLLGGLRKLTGSFHVDDYTQRLIDQPERFETDYMVNSLVKRFAAKSLLRFAYWAFPGYVWLLRKQVAAS